MHKMQQYTQKKKGLPSPEREKQRYDNSPPCVMAKCHEGQTPCFKFLEVGVNLSKFYLNLDPFGHKVFLIPFSELNYHAFYHLVCCSWGRVEYRLHNLNDVIV